MTETLLTIMLPTTVDRRTKFYMLLKEITEQLDFCLFSDKIEILIDEDNKEKSIGLKRQHLLERAKGEFVVGIDSDDFIHKRYLYEIINALVRNPHVDHVGFIESCSIDGVKSKSIFSIKYQSWNDTAEGYDHVRCANPKSVIRREIALQVGYEDLRYAEDIKFSEAVTPLLKSEVFINSELYYYNYISTPHEIRYGLNRD